MPSLRRRASVTDTDPVEEPAKTPANAADALTLAEQAEAEAAEAEAVAQPASARAKAIRMRREAQTADTAAAEGRPPPRDGTPPPGRPPPTRHRRRAAPPTPAADGRRHGRRRRTATADRPSRQTATAEHSGIDIDQVENASREASAPTGRRWGLVLKIVAITVGVLGTAALVAASVYMVRQTVRPTTAAAECGVRRGGPAERRDIDVAGLQQCRGRRQTIIDNSTGQFKKDFEDQSADFIKVAQDSKVITDVTVNATAVESMSQDSAVVMVSATSRVTNSAGAKQEPRAWRLSVNLQRTVDRSRCRKSSSYRDRGQGRRQGRRRDKDVDKDADETSEAVELTEAVEISEPDNAVDIGDEKVAKVASTDSVGRRLMRGAGRNIVAILVAAGAGHLQRRRAHPPLRSAEKALEMAADIGLSRLVFKASFSWSKGFLQRHRLAMRARTRVGQTTAEDGEATREEFSQNIARIVSDEGIYQVLNADQTAVNFEYLPRLTVDVSGAKTIWVQCAGKDKARLMAMLLADLYGQEISTVSCPEGQAVDEQGHPRAKLEERQGFGVDLWRRVVEPFKMGLGAGSTATGRHSERVDHVQLLFSLWLPAGHGRGQGASAPRRYVSPLYPKVKARAAALNVRLEGIPAKYTWICNLADLAWIKPMKDRLRSIDLIHARSASCISKCTWQESLPDERLVQPRGHFGVKWADIASRSGAPCPREAQSENKKVQHDRLCPPCRPVAVDPAPRPV